MDIIESTSKLESDKVERILLESVSMDKIDQVFQEDEDQIPETRKEAWKESCSSCNSKDPC